MAQTAAFHRIHPDDDVAVALRDADAGEKIGAVIATGPVSRGHKLALRAIAAGAPVRKFGFPIGVATTAIAPGEHVHSHNLATGLAGELSYAFETAAALPDPVDDGRRFLGYRRADGRVGTRNEIWILVTVGCVAETARRIAAEAGERFAGRVDGVHAFPHPFGCSQLGDDLSATRAMLAALARHPNAGGVLILGLGCESNQLAGLLADVGDRGGRLRGDPLVEAEKPTELDGIAEGRGQFPPPCRRPLVRHDRGHGPRVAAVGD